MRPRVAPILGRGGGLSNGGPGAVFGAAGMLAASTGGLDFLRREDRFNVRKVRSGGLRGKSTSFSAASRSESPDSPSPPGRCRMLDGRSATGYSQGVTYPDPAGHAGVDAGRACRRACWNWGPGRTPTTIVAAGGDWPGRFSSRESGGENGRMDAPWRRFSRVHSAPPWDASRRRRWMPVDRAGWGFWWCLRNDVASSVPIFSAPRGRR